MDETLEAVIEDIEILAEDTSLFSANEAKPSEAEQEDVPIKPVWEDVVPEASEMYVHRIVFSYEGSEDKKTLVETIGSDEVRVKHTIDIAESPVQELDLGQEGFRDPVKYAHIRSHRERLTEILKWQDARAWWYFDHRIRPYGKR